MAAQPETSQPRKVQLSRIDSRSPRFAAALTTAVFVVVLVTGNGWLALAQAVAFALGAWHPRYSPSGVLYRRLVAPLLGPPAVLEPTAPVRFSQAVGLAFALVSAAGYLGGVPAVGIVAAGCALAAAFLNAAFGYCLGCQLHLLVARHVPATKESA